VNLKYCLIFVVVELPSEEGKFLRFFDTLCDLHNEEHLIIVFTVNNMIFWISSFLTC